MNNKNKKNKKNKGQKQQQKQKGGGGGKAAAAGSDEETWEEMLKKPLPEEVTAESSIQASALDSASQVPQEESKDVADGAEESTQATTASQVEDEA